MNAGMSAWHAGRTAGHAWMPAWHAEMPACYAGMSAGVRTAPRNAGWSAWYAGSPADHGGMSARNAGMSAVDVESPQDDSAFWSALVEMGSPTPGALNWQRVQYQGSFGLVN